MNVNLPGSPKPLLRDVADRMRVKALLVELINEAMEERERSDVAGTAVDRNFANGRLDSLLQIWHVLLNTEN